MSIVLDKELLGHGIFPKGPLATCAVDIKPKMAAADKNVVGLLNGIARRDYFGESEITDEFLHQELFSDLSAEQFDLVLKRYETLMRNIVSGDMDYNQLEAFLTSQMKRKQGSLTQEQAAAFLKFWKSQKVKIHEILVQRSSWNNKLKDINWRIDLKTQARHLQQINTPVAIVEMQIEKRGTDSKETDVFQFEMDESQLSNVLSSIGEIEKKLNNYAQ